jgi:hypothetical protein
MASKRKIKINKNFYVIFYLFFLIAANTRLFKIISLIVSVYYSRVNWLIVSYYMLEHGDGLRDLSIYLHLYISHQDHDYPKPNYHLFHQY